MQKLSHARTVTQCGMNSVAGGICWNQAHTCVPKVHDEHVRPITDGFGHPHACICVYQCLTGVGIWLKSGQICYKTTRARRHVAPKHVKASIYAW